MIRTSAILTVLLAAAAPSGDLDVRTEAYRSAARSGALGAVTGHVLPAGPTPERPQESGAGITIVLVPRSPNLLAALENARRHSRDSLREYLASVAELRRLWEAYEDDLRGAGAADLVRTVTTNARGHFVVDDLAAGAWILIAEKATAFGAKKPLKTSKKRQGDFMTPAGPAGYRDVTVWLFELSVEGGRAEVVELGDRNAWFQGVEEQTAPGAVDSRRRRGR